jgi:hypothetical protein
MATRDAQAIQRTRAHIYDPGREGGGGALEWAPPRRLRPTGVRPDPRPIMTQLRYGKDFLQADHTEPPPAAPRPRHARRTVRERKGADEM